MMAAQVRIQVVLNSQGVRDLLNSDGISAACKKAAESIRSRAGKHYHIRGPYHPGTRVVYRVYPDRIGRYQEARDKTLTRALKSSRVRGR